MGNPFQSSNKAQFTSSAITNQAQGGGNKKYGLPPQVGNIAWSSMVYNSSPFLNSNSYSRKCCSKNKLATLNFWQAKVSQSRPIGSSVEAGRAYWHIPGTN